MRPGVGAARVTNAAPHGAPRTRVRTRGVRARTSRGRRSASTRRSHGGRPPPRSIGASPGTRAGTPRGPAVRSGAPTCAWPHEHSSASRSAHGTRTPPRTLPVRGRTSASASCRSAARAMADDELVGESRLLDGLGNLVAVQRRERAAIRWSTCDDAGGRGTRRSRRARRSGNRCARTRARDGGDGCGAPPRTRVATRRVRRCRAVAPATATGHRRDSVCG